MSHKFLFRTSGFYLVLSIALILIACSQVSPLPDTPLPSPPPTASPTPTTPMPIQSTPARQTFAVLADRGWDSTALFVRPGQQFEIKASGSWGDGGEEITYGPGGRDKFEPDAILPSAPIGALLGRIGNNAPFEIGEHILMAANFGGELQLSINDQPEALSDNTGTLEATVALGPEPGIPTQLLTNEIDGYRLLIPAGYQAVIYEKGMCLTLTGAWMMACHVANASIEVGDAGGRTLSQVADEVAAEGNPDIPVRRTGLTVSGVEAIRLDDVYTYDVLRKVVIVQDDRIYILTFAPWSDQIDEFPRIEHLYDTVIRSFNLLPQPWAVDPPEETSGSYISAVSPVTIYAGPSRNYTTVGVLELGASALVIGGQDGEYWPERWMNITCPEGIAGACWVLWDMNTLYSYEGPPVALEIPDPAGLAVESTRAFASPDARWQVKSTESEVVSLGPDDAQFFYVEFTVTSLADGTTWRPVSEWRVYGLGLETAPQPFHWSQDGRFFYYTSLVVPDGGCGFFANSGESVDRLDLRDGTVSVLQPPYNRWMLSISPDETRMAYLSFIDGYHLIVRDLEGAYSAGPSGQDSIQWQISLDLAAPRVVSQIDWSPDGQKVLVTVADIASNCQPVQATEWELDIDSGDFVEGTKIFFPTPTP